MKLLLEGNLNDTLMENRPFLSMKDLLTGILQAEAPGLSLLKLANPKKEEQAEIYFLGGHYIVGAKLHNKVSVSGLAALDRILHFRQASFVYYACESLDSLPQSQDLKIDLKEMIEHWQDAKPISEGQLLDKIFNVSSPVGTIESAVAQVIPDLQARESGEIKSDFVVKNKSEFVSAKETISKDKDINWDMVESLVSASPNNETGSETGWSTGTVWSSGNYDRVTESPDPQESKILYTQELRSLSSEVSWQRKLRSLSTILTIFLIASIVIFFSAWLLMNMPSSHLAPRRFSLFNPEKHGSNKR